MKPIKRVAVIHDLCGVGKAALTNILPILSVMGIEPCPVPTMILSTHTGGYGVPNMVRLPGYIKACADHYTANQIMFDAIFIGYLGSHEVIEEVIYFISKYPDALIIVDPVFGDHGKCYRNFDMNYVEAIKALLPYASVITPNFTEACFLAGNDYEQEFSISTINKVCEKLLCLGPSNVVITSLPEDESGKSGNMIADRNTKEVINYRSTGDAYPGTGDIFTAVMIGSLLQDKCLKESCQRAHEFVYDCLEKSSQYDYPVREGVMLESVLKSLV